MPSQKKHREPSYRRKDYEEDGYTGSRLSKLMESMAQRLRKDGLKLFLLVLANGLYLYLGGMVFYFLEKNEDVNISHGKEVARVLQAALKVMHII